MSLLSATTHNAERSMRPLGLVRATATETKHSLVGEYRAMFVDIQAPPGGA